MKTLIASHILSLILVFVLAPTFVAADETTTTNSSNVDKLYTSQVAPLFKSKCLECHNAESRKGELDLSNLIAILLGGESGKVVDSQNPGQSLILDKVRSGEMPPDKAEQLSVEQVSILEQWIDLLAKDNHSSASRITQHDVLPILLRRCTACHGRAIQEGGLDLRSRSAMLQGGNSGPAIVPGNSANSLLIQNIRTQKMPPLDRLVDACVKPIESDETKLVAQWIDAGAPEIEIKPDMADGSDDPLVTDKDRDFWSFRPPVVGHSVAGPSSIDTFISRKLQPLGLEIGPPADRLTLLRRVYIDLTGMPPDPDEVENYLNDNHPLAYERLVDRLLSSPRYGERWARYWLDLAGYSDSEGKREQDLPRAYAWRYRDYVINALNSDKPYDRFVLEQIAGDELYNHEQADEITEPIYEAMVATAFLRMAPDPTWANITGYVPDRIDVMADAFDILGSSIMGLTLKCARCHSHKFDPIPQRDYFRLVDVFKGAYDEYNWIKPEVRPGIGPVSKDVIGGRTLPYVTSEERRNWQAACAKIDGEIAQAKQQPNSESLIKAIEARRPPEPRVQALWDQGEPSPTYIYRRGDPLSPGRLVGPGVPSVLSDGKSPLEIQPPWPGSKKTGRRLAFAKWLVRPDHPLTARVIVNRIWKHHFGTGIVKTLGNFGKAGAEPTHPELLDWLAVEFVNSGWSIKSLHRMMLNSAVYKQSSQIDGNRLAKDPDNQWYSRMPLNRLDAESLYDSMLVASGKLNSRKFGPADSLTTRADGLATVSSTKNGLRRLIYVQQQRKIVATHLESFDYPQMNPNCLQRRDSIVAPQALYLFNNGMVYELAEHFAVRAFREVGPNTDEQIEFVYKTALSRVPSEEEKRIGMDAIDQLTKEYSTKITDGQDARRQAMVAFCHAIFNSAAFIYVD